MTQSLNFDLIILLPLVCGMVIVIIGCIKFKKIRKVKDPQTIGIFEIWLVGIIAMLLGIFGQIVLIIESFDVVTSAGEISAVTVAHSIKNSYMPTLTGLFVLVISLIVWGILKGIKQQKCRQQK